MKNPSLEQLLEAQKANNEVLLGLVRKTIDGVEQLAALNLNASREFLDSAVANAEQLAAIKDPKDLAKVGSSLAQPGVDKVVGYSKSIYDVVSSLQREVVSIAESQFKTATKVAQEAIDKATANAPAGTEAITAAIKQAVAASTTAFDNLSAATKQITAAAEGNLKAAGEAAAKAVGNVGKKK